MKLEGILLSFVLLISGCLSEANFELAPVSRLPKWIELPSGASRDEVSISLSTYIYPAEWVSIIELKEKGHIFASDEIRLSEPTPFVSGSDANYRWDYPVYRAFTHNGITDILEFRKPEPYFYMADDPEIWAKLDGLGIRRFNESFLVPRH